MGVDVKIISRGADGIISVLINGKKYSYSVDTALIPRWEKMIEKAPGKVLEEIKNNARWFVAY